MNKKLQIVILCTFAVGLIVSMLVIGMLTAQPVAAQTPTPMYWKGECSDWLPYVGGSGAPVTWGTNAFTCSSVLSGVIGELRNVTYNGDVDARNSGLSPYPQHPIEGEIRLHVCGDDMYHPGACVGIGQTRDADWVAEGACTDGWIDDGGIWQWGTSGGWEARVCPIYYSPPPPLPECGLPVISDTHFASNTWTVNTAAWSYSFYDIGPGGSIRKNGAFGSTGNYEVAVLAESSITGVLSLSAGGTAVTVTIVPTSTYAWYTTTFSVASLTPEILVVASADNSANISMDQICISLGGVLSCGVVNDYHFYSNYSWTAAAGAAWAVHNWTVPNGASIEQSVEITQAGAYSITMVAKSIAESDFFVHFKVDGIEVGSVPVLHGDTDWTTYVISAEIALGSHTFNTSADDSSAIIDSICVLPVSVSGFGPCGISLADMIYSKSNYIADPGMETGVILPVPYIGAVGLPYNIVVGIDSGWDLLTGWSKGPAGPELPQMNLVDGLLRSYNGTNALGLVPIPLSRGVQHYYTPPAGGYNVVLRMNRAYDNAKLYVNTRDAGYSASGTWSDASVYLDGDGYVLLTSDCGGALCNTPISGAGLSSVYVDDVYIVPGPEIVCGAMAPITTPLGSCINVNPDFELASDSWTLVGGASIYDGWARLPGGSFIEQDVPAASTTDPTWTQTALYINAGQRYNINVKAHLEDQNQPGQFTVIAGASSPGQVSFNHQVVGNPSLDETDEFTATVDMMGSGANPTVKIRIVNEAGGVVAIDSVCVTYSGSGPLAPVVPIGPCLGTWETSAGGDAIGVEIPGNDYVANDQNAMYGSYVLDVSGIAGQDTNTLRVSYYNLGNGMIDSAGIMDIVGYAWTGQLVFVVPPGGWYNGQLQIVNDNTLTYDNICLRVNGTGPTPTQPRPPEAMPYPECGSINSPYTTTAGFYMLSPYSITAEYTGTVPAYVAELTYNYAIYPLVCTTISIANWQYRVVRGFSEMFEYVSLIIIADLASIIDLLKQILDKLQDPAPPTCGLLDVAIWLFKAVFTIFLKILKLLLQGVELFIKIFKEMTLEVRGEAAVQYPFSCGGSGQWMCFALAGIMSLDQHVGDWLNIIALIVCSMLTVSLVFWVIDQIRGMLQPGTESSDAD